MRSKTIFSGALERRMSRPCGIASAALQHDPGANVRATKPHSLHATGGHRLYELALRLILGVSAVRAQNVEAESLATDRVEAFVEEAAGRPILTVSDAPDFLDVGGMIELRIVERASGSA